MRRRRPRPSAAADQATATTLTEAVIDPGDGGDYQPTLRAQDAVAVIDNPYFPLPVGARWVYEGTSDGDAERIEVEVLTETRRVMGIDAVVVRDRAYIDGELAEDTLDFFTQDRDGNVWYLGEETAEYDNGVITTTAGSFQAGVDGALPGLIMPADPDVGDAYRQEFYPGEAEDMGEVIAVGGTATVPFGTFTDVLTTQGRRWNPTSSREALRPRRRLHRCGHRRGRRGHRRARRVRPRPLRRSGPFQPDPSPSTQPPRRSHAQHPQPHPRRRAATLAAASIGTGIAAATGGDDGPEDDHPDTAITGADLDRAEAAALDHTGEGTVTDTEVGDEESLYEVEVTLDDGTHVDVQLDENFAVVSSESDGTQDDDDPPARRRRRHRRQSRRVIDSRQAYEAERSVRLHGQRSTRQATPSSSPVSRNSGCSEVPGGVSRR